MWLRLRFRHNPGFVTAATAGSIGLLLALYLLLNGGLGYFGGEKAETEGIANDDLGEEEKLLPRRDSLVSAPRVKSDSDRFGFGEDGRGRAFLPPKTADDDDISDKPSLARPRKLPRIDDEPVLAEEPSNEEPDSNDPPAIVTERAVASRDKQPKEEEPEEEDEPKSDDDGGFLPNHEPVVARSEEKPAEDDTPPARTKPALATLPVFVDDNEKDDDVKKEGEKTADEKKDDEPQKSISQTTIVASGDPQSKAIEAEIPAADDDPFVSPQRPSSWRDSKAKPLPPVKEPVAGSARQSRAVETAVFATPEREAPRTTQARPSAEPAKLDLEIRAPKSVSPGQTFDIEFIVTNNSRQSVEGANLSVALPPGLVHPQGPELEQPIASIAGCQQYRGRMKVKAVGSGELSPRADVSVRGTIGAQSSVTLRVGTARVVRSGSFDPCACEPIRTVR
jgi:hypothetical protein